MNDTTKNSNDLVKIWNGNVMLTYGKEYNGNHSLAEFKGYVINWMDNDKKVFSTNHCSAHTKPYKSLKKWADTMEKIIMSFNDNTTYSDICKIVGYGNYSEYYTDN